MGRKRSVLLMARGARLHRFFREMARDLVRDHRVTVLATPEEIESFSSLPGVEQRCYASPDLAPCAGRHGSPPRPRLVPFQLFGAIDRVWSRHDVWRKALDSYEVHLVGTALEAEAAKIERELGLPVYRVASNYLLFGRLVRETGGRWDYMTTAEEILSAYVGSYWQLSEIFEQVAPDVVFFESMDVVSSYVAFALALRRGVFALEPRFSPLGRGKISLTFGIYRRNVIMEHLYAHRHLIADVHRREADRLVASAQTELERSSYAAVHRSMLERNSPLYRLAEVLVDHRRGWHALRDVRRHLRASRNRRWLERHLTRTIPEEPYLLVPLQHVPEAGICSQSPRWVNQGAMVEQLAINAPSHLKVVVKEHPRTLGSRGKTFFAPLAALPNVVLCHPSVSIWALLRGAAGIVTVTGTPGFEGLILGKRVGVLGRPFYSIYPGVKRLGYPEEMYEALEDAFWKPEAMAEERREFLAAYLQSLHEFGHGEGAKLYPTSGGERWAAALRATMRFIEAHSLRPGDFQAGL